MIRRIGGNIGLRKEPAPEASHALERDGYCVLREVFPADAVAALAREIEAVFAASPPDRERDTKGEWRYAMLNRSPLSQAAIAAPQILETIEPLLGEDCHIIANTAWRNPPDFAGGPWHVDAGPHVPRPEGVPWDTRIPYPVFAVGAHLYLKDCLLPCGPTAVIPGSHRSGRLPPRDALWSEDLSYEGRAPVAMTAQAGDVALFVSDVWHRGMPAKGGDGRYFLQAHYARRDLAQRLLPTEESHQLTDEAVARAETEREKRLAGLHPLGFYDG